MNMHDNDMDKLFRSKLDNFEVEPSANVWAGISAELGNAPKRKSIVPMLRIAAGVAVIISAGLFFLPKKQMEVEPTKGPKLAMNPQVKPATVQRAQPQTPAQTPSVNVVVPVQQVASVRTHSSSPVVGHTVSQTLVTGSVSQQPVATTVQVDPVVNTQPQMIAAVTTTTTNTSKPIVPDGNTPIVEKPTDAPSTFNTTKPVAVIAAVSNADNDTKPTPAKKHKLSLGGILNAAVGLVDKRQDKLIEFGNNDEGETITGINLGIIKVKKVE